jgi:hypothetical protein
VFGVVPHVQDLARCRQKMSSGLGHRRSSRQALEKSLASPLLKLPDLKTQVALRHTQAFGRFTKVARFSDGNKRCEVTKLGTLVHDAPTFWLYSAGRSVRGQLMQYGDLLPAKPFWLPT